MSICNFRSAKALNLPSFIALTVFLVLFSVPGYSQSWLNEEKDVVNGSHRLSFEITNSLMANRRSMGTLTQTYLKETKDSVAVYRVYDVLSLYEKCFSVDKNVYVIIDEQPFQLITEYIESTVKTDLSEENSNVLKADSTTLSVVTGYNASSRIIVKASYRIPQPAIDRFPSANNIVIRYYAGPYMLNAKLRASDLLKLQRITQED